MPAVLPEFGFHDNPEEAQWLIDSMPRIAEETAQAVCEFFAVPYVAPAETEQPVTPEPPVADTPLYRVQVGAFAVRANAERMLAKLKAAGFEGYIREYCEKVKAAGFPEAFVV